MHDPSLLLYIGHPLPHQISRFFLSYCQPVTSRLCNTPHSHPPLGSEVLCSAQLSWGVSFYIKFLLLGFPFFSVPHPHFFPLNGVKSTQAPWRRAEGTCAAHAPTLPPWPHRLGCTVKGLVPMVPAQCDSGEEDICCLPELGDPGTHLRPSPFPALSVLKARLTLHLLSPERHPGGQGSPGCGQVE